MFKTSNSITCGIKTRYFHMHSKMYNKYQTFIVVKTLETTIIYICSIVQIRQQFKYYYRVVNLACYGKATTNDYNKCIFIFIHDAAYVLINAPVQISWRLQAS